MRVRSEACTEAAPADLLQRAQGPEARGEPHRDVRPVGLDRIQDTPDEIKQWRGAIQRGLEELGSSRSVDGLEICTMLWFVITDQETDQTPQGKASNLLAGTAAQITDKLKRYKEAGLTMPLLWPPFQDVPVAKTLDDLKRLKEEIMPQIDAT